jgi:Ca2+-binding RTX toxin-like protein
VFHSYFGGNGDDIMDGGNGADNFNCGGGTDTIAVSVPFKGMLNQKIVKLIRFT